MTGTPEERFREIVFAHAIREEQRLRETKLLAHYTTAENALNILNSGEFWLRQASLMNDLREVELGKQCVDAALSTSGGKQLGLHLNSVFPGLWEELTGHFTEMLSDARSTTFLASLCEHDPTDLMGTLSMWRAYGGKAGVAILIDPKVAFADDGVQLGVATSPAVYGEPQFFAEFGEFVSRIILNISFLAQMPRDMVKDEIFTAMQFAALSTKHLGFQEEREWRIVHLPKEMRDDYIALRTHSIGGIPQIVAPLPLCSRNSEPFPYTLDQSIYRVIVGPSPYALEIAQAFTLRMGQLGFTNPSSRVFFSNIPLRQG